MQNTQTTSKTQQQQQQKTHSWMGKRLGKAFLQGRYTGGQQAYENMLNITNANANQN